MGKLLLLEKLELSELKNRLLIMTLLHFMGDKDGIYLEAVGKKYCLFLNYDFAPDDVIQVFEADDDPNFEDGKLVRMVCVDEDEEGHGTFVAKDEEDLN